MSPTPPPLVSLCLLAACLLGLGCDEAPGLMLNEFVASNSSGVADESGAFPDWIEIHNTSSESVSLAGWFLSDDLDNPTRHALPEDLSIEGGVVAAEALGLAAEVLDLALLPGSHPCSALLIGLDLTSQIDLHMIPKPWRCHGSVADGSINVGEGLLPMGAAGEDFAQQQRGIGVGGIEAEQHAQPLGCSGQLALLSVGQCLIVEGGRSV